jgi:hypothetical protein
VKICRSTYSVTFLYTTTKRQRRHLRLCSWSVDYGMKRLSNLTVSGLISTSALQMDRRHCFALAIYPADCREVGGPARSISAWKRYNCLKGAVNTTARIVDAFESLKTSWRLSSRSSLGLMDPSARAGERSPSILTGGHSMISRRMLDSSRIQLRIFVSYD